MKKPETPAAPPPAPSVLDEQNRALTEDVRQKQRRRGYSSTILTKGMRTGGSSGQTGSKQRVTVLGRS